MTYVFCKHLFFEVFVEDHHAPSFTSLHKKAFRAAAFQGRAPESDRAACELNSTFWWPAGNFQCLRLELLIFHNKNV